MKFITDNTNIIDPCNKFYNLLCNAYHLTEGRKPTYVVSPVLECSCNQERHSIFVNIISLNVRENKILETNMWWFYIMQWKNTDIQKVFRYCLHLHMILEMHRIYLIFLLPWRGIRKYLSSCHLLSFGLVNQLWFFWKLKLRMRIFLHFSLSFRIHTLNKNTTCHFSSSIISIRQST